MLLCTREHNDPNAFLMPFIYGNLEWKRIAHWTWACICHIVDSFRYSCLRHASTGAHIRKCSCAVDNVDSACECVWVMFARGCARAQLTCTTFTSIGRHQKWNNTQIVMDHVNYNGKFVLQWSYDNAFWNLAFEHAYAIRTHDLYLFHSVMCNFTHHWITFRWINGCAKWPNR